MPVLSRGRWQLIFSHTLQKTLFHSPAFFLSKVSRSLHHHIFPYSHPSFTYSERQLILTKMNEKPHKTQRTSTDLYFHVLSSLGFSSQYPTFPSLCCIFSLLICEANALLFLYTHRVGFPPHLFGGFVQTIISGRVTEEISTLSIISTP